MTIKDTTDEIKAILKELTDWLDRRAVWESKEKHDEIKTRIAHLYDKDQDHSHSPKELDNDLTDLETKTTAAGTQPVLGQCLRYLGNA